jgi:hypothetical protein
MNTENRCAKCGAELAANAPQGLCPACLLKGGLAAETGTLAGGAAKADYVPPTPAELAPHFPDLEILELVGQGGMGVVYKARQKRLDRLVALKILAPTIGQDPNFAERFAREARAMAMLSHPHVVAVHDFGQAPLAPSGRGAGGEGSLYYFLMEFVDGVNLRQLLDTGKLVPEEALAIVPQICEALQYAHDHGVVHRDIKPENVLLDKEGRVKIADFGLAKLVGRGVQDLTLTGVGQIMGTPQYMAPEQIEHPLRVDHRADIYSLGVVFYQMLTGELPIGRFGPPSTKVQIDVRLDDVVLRTLEKEPERRYQQASEVKTRIETIAATPRQGEEHKLHAMDPRSPSTGGPWQWADTIAMLGGMTFTSSRARWVANASAAGFLGFLACLAFIPLPAMRRCAGFSGFFGFFGLIGLAVFIEFVARYNASKRNGANSGPPPDGANGPIDPARRRVQGPAVGLLITGILDAVVTLAMGVLIAWYVLWGVRPMPDLPIVLAFPFVPSVVFTVITIVASLKMRRLDGFGWAVFGSILAVTSGNVIGLATGIWALVVLSDATVKKAFKEQERFKFGGVPPQPTRWHRCLGGVALAIFLLAVPLSLVAVALLQAAWQAAVLAAIAPGAAAMLLGLAAWRSKLGKAAVIGGGLLLLPGLTLFVAGSVEARMHWWRDLERKAAPITATWKGTSSSQSSKPTAWP